MIKTPQYRYHSQASPSLYIPPDFSLENYFNTKKLDIVNFFKQFNAIIHQTCLQTQLEIDQEYIKTLEMAKGINSHVLFQQCIKMKERENNVLVAITDIICMRVKQYLENKSVSNLNLQRSESVIYIKQQKTDHQSTPTQQQPSNDRSDMNRDLGQRARSLQTLLNAGNRSHDLNNCHKDKRSLSVMQKNQSICGDLDHKIQKDALKLLNRIQKPTYASQCNKQVAKRSPHLDPQCLKKPHRTEHYHGYSVCRKQSSMNCINQIVDSYSENQQLQRYIDTRINHTRPNRQITKKIR